MSLGLAGVLAFLALLAVRLVTRRDLAFRHRTLKRGGRLLPAGRCFAAGLGLLALFWVHSGWLQFEVGAGRRAFATTARRASRRSRSPPSPPRRPPPSAPPRAPPPGTSAGSRAGVSSPGSASTAAWPGAAWLAGDLPGFRAASARAIARHDSAYEMLLLTGPRRRGARRSRRADARRRARRRARSASLRGLRRRRDAAGEERLAGGPRRRRRASSSVECFTFRLSPVLAYNWGIIHAMQGKPERAIERFRQVLSLEPGHREARENLAGMLAADRSNGRGGGALPRGDRRVAAGCRSARPPGADLDGDGQRRGGPGRARQPPWR